MNSDPKVKSEKFEERLEISIKDGILQDVSIDSIFELIRDIKDPEHSFTLEELRVVRKELIQIYEINTEKSSFPIGPPIKVIEIKFEPTIPHCSMAAIIGLTIKILLGKYIKGFYITCEILEGTHVNDKIINKQLKDKDRVQAASENESLMEVIEECIFKSEYKFLA